MTIEPGSRHVDLFVDGSTTRTQCWLSITTRNCDQYIFCDFFTSLLKSFEKYPEPEDVNDERCLLWDNLYLHNTSYVTHKIHDRVTSKKIMRLVLLIDLQWHRLSSFFVS